jgi:hypothetical protein
MQAEKLIDTDKRIGLDHGGTAPRCYRAWSHPTAIEPAAIEPAAIEPAAIEPAAIEPSNGTHAHFSNYPRCADGVDHGVNTSDVMTA